MSSRTRMLPRSELERELVHQAMGWRELAGRPPAMYLRLLRESRRSRREAYEQGRQDNEERTAIQCWKHEKTAYARGKADGRSRREAYLDGVHDGILLGDGTIESQLMVDAEKAYARGKADGAAMTVEEAAELVGYESYKDGYEAGRKAERADVIAEVHRQQNDFDDWRKFPSEFLQSIEAGEHVGASKKEGEHE